MRDQNGNERRFCCPWCTQESDPDLWAERWDHESITVRCGYAGSSFACLHVIATLSARFVPTPDLLRAEILEACEEEGHGSMNEGDGAEEQLG